MDFYIIFGLIVIFIILIILYYTESYKPYDVSGYITKPETKVHGISFGKTYGNKHEQDLVNNLANECNNNPECGLFNTYIVPTGMESVAFHGNLYKKNKYFLRPNSDMTSYVKST